MDEEHLQELMKHPEIQKAVAKAGEDALKNPEVQAKMLEVATEKFPELASSAASQIAEWAEDPECQEKARKTAAYIYDKAEDLVEDAAEEVMDLLKQGPAGVRALAFMGSVGAVAAAAMDVLKFWHLLFKPTSYLLDLYQIIFAFTSAIFECHPQTIEKFERLDKWHDMLVLYAKFLCYPAGRACFYFFQGSLWIVEVISEAQDSDKKFFRTPAEWVKFLVGAYMMFIALLNLWMHWGIMPVQGLNKTAKTLAPVTAVVSAVASRMTQMGGDILLDVQQRISVIRDPDDLDGSRKSKRESKSESLLGQRPSGQEIEMADKKSEPPAFGSGGF